MDAAVTNALVGVCYANSNLLKLQGRNFNRPCPQKLHRLFLSSNIFLGSMLLPFFPNRNTTYNLLLTFHKLCNEGNHSRFFSYFCSSLFAHCSFFMPPSQSNCKIHYQGRTVFSLPSLFFPKLHGLTL